MQRPLSPSVLGLLGFLGTGLMGCGGSALTPLDACTQAMAAMCERSSACGGTAALNTLGGYTSVSDCTKGMQATNCAASNLGCSTGEAFKPDQAQKCIDSLRSQACTDVSDGVEPVACSLVCVSGGTGGTGGGGGGGTGGTSGGGTGGTNGGTGTLSAQDACKQVMAALCERTSTCAGSTGLSALGYTSVSSCTTGMQSLDCATPAQAGCSTGQTYHADQAKKCVDSMVAQSCSDFTAGTTPAVCDLVCQ
jgi:hypothetical protein